MKNPFSVLFGGLFLIVFLLAPASAGELTRVAKRLAKGMKAFPNKHVAVLPFTYPHDEVSSGSTLVAERLTTELVKRKVSVVERSQMEKVQSELRLEMSGAIDAVSAKKLGKMLGVDAVITGTLVDFENRETEVNARLILTETGQILAAESATLTRPWMDPPRRVFVDTAPASSGGERSKVMMSALIPVHFGPGGPGPNDPGLQSGHNSKPAPFAFSENSPVGGRPTIYTAPAYYTPQYKKPRYHKP